MLKQIQAFEEPPGSIGLKQPWDSPKDSGVLLVWAGPGVGLELFNKTDGQVKL
jgi:hypothetical protein